MDRYNMTAASVRFLIYQLKWRKKQESGWGFFSWDKSERALVLCNPGYIELIDFTPVLLMGLALPHEHLMGDFLSV